MNLIHKYQSFFAAIVIASLAGCQQGSSPEGLGGSDNKSLRQVAVSGFFGEDVIAGADLDQDRVFPRGSQMMLSMFSIKGEADLQRAKTAGFTMAGPYYGKDQAQDNAAAARLGFKCFESIGGDRKSVGLPMSGKQPTAMSELELVELVKSQVKAVLSDPLRNSQCGCWYVTPEELRPWRKEEMAFLKTVSDTARGLDPLKRPVWMYEPNHRAAQELATTGQYQDLIGKGSYVNTGKTNALVAHPIPHVWIRWSVEQQVKAVEALAGEATNDVNRVPIAVLEMSQDPQNESQFSEIPSWVRHDVYLSLVSGAKGVLIWSAFRRKGFEKTRDTYFDAYLKTTAGIVEHGLDDVFLFGTRRNDLLVEVVDGPAILPLDIEQQKEVVKLEFPSVAFLDVSHRSDRYVMLVNSATDEVTVKVSGFPQKDFRVESLLTQSKPEIKTGEATVCMKPLDVKIWKLTGTTISTADKTTATIVGSVN